MSGGPSIADDSAGAQPTGAVSMNDSHIPAAQLLGIGMNPRRVMNASYSQRKFDSEGAINGGLIQVS
jgi:hypothetical protein